MVAEATIAREPVMAIAIRGRSCDNSDNLSHMTQ